MRVVLQRVSKAKVEVDNQISGEIDQGLLVYVGFSHDDDNEDLEYMANKVVNLRIFSDDEGKMNLSVKDIGGEILSISQFTLYGDTRKGRRPNFMDALGGDEAKILYDKFNQILKKEINVEEGIFGGDMKVSSVNDGPVTILIDSKKNF